MGQFRSCCCCFCLAYGVPPSSSFASSPFPLLPHLPPPPPPHAPSLSLSLFLSLPPFLSCHRWRQARQGLHRLLLRQRDRTSTRIHFKPSPQHWSGAKTIRLAVPASMVDHPRLPLPPPRTQAHHQAAINAGSRRSLSPSSPILSHLAVLLDEVDAMTRVDLELRKVAGLRLDDHSIDSREQARAGRQRRREEGPEDNWRAATQTTATMAVGKVSEVAIRNASYSTARGKHMHSRDSLVGKMCERRDC